MHCAFERLDDMIVHGNLFLIDDAFDYHNHIPQPTINVERNTVTLQFLKISQHLRCCLSGKTWALR